MWAVDAGLLRHTPGSRGGADKAPGTMSLWGYGVDLSTVSLQLPVLSQAWPCMDLCQSASPDL